MRPPLHWPRQGNWREEHLFALKQAVDLYRFYQRQLAEVDAQLESCLQTFEDRSNGQTVPRPPKRKAGSNAPEFDTRKLLLQMTGVDLTRSTESVAIPPWNSFRKSAWTWASGRPRSTSHRGFVSVRETR